MPGTGVREDVYALAKALRHRDRFVRRHAAAMLGGLGIEATAAIEDLGLAAIDRDAWTAIRAIRALGRLGAEAAVHLREALEHPDVTVRREGVWALKELGAAARAALPALVNALRDPDPRVRMGAAQVLGAVGDSGAVPALAAALGDTNLIFARLAAQALARIGTASLPLLSTLHEHPDRHVRREAAWAIGQIEKLARAESAEVSPRPPISPAATQRIDCLPRREAHTRTAPMGSA
jgi:HEAT repeat protein